MKLSNFQSALVTIPMIEGFSVEKSYPCPHGHRFRHATIKGLSVRVRRFKVKGTKEDHIIVFLEDFTGFEKGMTFIDRKQLRLSIEKAMFEYRIYVL